MRRSIFALAVVAAALPGLALAGEPVPMTDSDLDSVAAGLSLSDVLAVLTLTDQQIVNHPSYNSARAEAIASVKGLSESQVGSLRTQIGLLFPSLSAEDQGQVRRLAPAELLHLLPEPK
jgi:hypothetical protein